MPNTPKKTETTIKSSAVETVHSLIGNAKIVGMEIRNGWLVASLNSGTYFWVRNI